tara:strand:- start:560 stop:1813 length:1254 start_codon:yes stop_codon:yes gene_type:complete
MKKNIYILGGSLYGCFLAYQFSKKKNYNVNLIENSDKLITSLNPIFLGKFKFNNGLHIFELPRSQDIVKFFKKKLKIKFNFYQNDKKNLFERNIINYNEKLSNWPEEIKKNVKLKKKIYNSNQNLKDYFKKDLIKLFEKSSSRFSNTFNESKKLFLPFFLPGDIRDISKDEGMVSRNMLKTSKKTLKIATLKKYLFCSLQNPMEKFLKKRGVKIFFKTKINFNNNKIKFFKKDKEIKIFKNNMDKVFFCLNSAVMLKDLYPKYLSELTKVRIFFYNCLIEIDKKEKPLNFSEMLCLNSKVPNVNRITCPSNYFNFQKRKYLQIELFSKNELNLKKIKKNIILEIKEIFLLKKKPKIVDFKNTRIIYSPDKFWTKKSIKKCKIWIKNNEKKIFSRFNFLPVNMNKTWIWAKEDFKKYN